MVRYYFIISNKYQEGVTADIFPPVASPLVPCINPTIMVGEEVDIRIPEPTS